MGIIKDIILNNQDNQGAQKMSKYEEALAKYNTNIDDQAVRDAVHKIIAEKVPENDTMDVKRFLFGSIGHDAGKFANFLCKASHVGKLGEIAHAILLYPTVYRLLRFLYCHIFIVLFISPSNIP